MGVVGLGMGKGHAEGYLTHPDVDEVVLCDADAGRLQAVGDELGVTERYADPLVMFRNAGLDGVSIAVPNALHAPLTIMALRHGLHVLCEKPMATTTVEARRMNTAAAKAGRSLMINFSQRFEAASMAAKEQVDAGTVGPIYFGRTVWHRRRGVPKFGGWFGIHALSGGGPLMDLGVHRLDLALWLMGYPEPVSVTGSTYNVIVAPRARKQKKKFDVEELGCGLVKFDNGATLIVEASWAVNLPGSDSMITSLSGAKGGLVHRYGNGGYEAEIYTEENGSLYTKRLDARESPTPSAYAEFVDSIVQGRPPSVTGTEGLKVVKILEGIYRSAQSGREVRFRAAN